MIITIFILSIIVIILVFIRINSVLCLGKSFKNMIFYLFIMVFSNFLCLFSNNVIFFISILMFLSLYSMYMVINGYGFGYKVFAILFFKAFADVLIIFFVANLLFLDNISFFNSFLFHPNFITIFIFILILLVYSLFGLFGFWLFMAMEASYFISTFMHSCGFISVGLLTISKLSYLGVLESMPLLITFINIISLISYFIFLLFFLTTKDCKKSFGFYSASSICFLIFLSINFPYLCFIYFFLSSVIKILIFEMLSFLNKVDYFKWLVFVLFIFNIFLCSLFILISSKGSFFPKEILYIILFNKIWCLVVFSFKVFSFLEFKSFNICKYILNFIVLLFLVFKVVSFILLNDYIISYLSYFLLYSLLIVFSFYPLKSLSFLWVFLFNTTKFLGSLILIFYNNIIKYFSFNYKDLLFKFFKINSLNTKQILLYCILIVILLILFI